MAPLALAAGLALSFTGIGVFVATMGFSIGLDMGCFAVSRRTCRSRSAWYWCIAGLAAFTDHANMMQWIDAPSSFHAFDFTGAAVAEIAGCFAFWVWLRQGQSIWWLVPGVISLAAFAYLLTLAPSDHAGRAYAAYGGVYLVASLSWLWIIESRHPDQWDLLGGTLALVAAVIILFAPRAP